MIINRNSEKKSKYKEYFDYIESATAITDLINIRSLHFEYINESLDIFSLKLKGLDVKARYSSGVYTNKTMALSDENLRRKIARGIKRAEAHKHEWIAVNINDAVERFAPGSDPVYENGKIIFYSQDEKYAVIADVGGGYLRIQDLTKKTKNRSYLNLDGSDGHNYVDKDGKTHGKDHSEYEKTTHFRIKKRGEM